MKKIELLLATMLLLTASCANEDINKDNGNNTNKGLTTFMSGDEPTTRTSMDRTASNGGKFFWTTDDNIWVDNGGTPESSTSSSITGKTDYAKFYFASTFSGTSYPVTYTGKNSTKANEVTIADEQTQSAPNNTEHFATSGDCGTATATGGGDKFTFKLKHQAAYLCILPRNENTELVGKIYLTKVVVTSDNDIAGTYNLTSAGLSSAPISGGTKTITLTTEGTGNVLGTVNTFLNQQMSIPSPGFLLNNTTTDRNTSAYMVIAPGHHTLKIDCYVKDPVSDVRVKLTQTVSADFHANTVTDITADVTPTRTIYPGIGQYYMWDAKQNFWYGYEDKQQTINDLSDPTYYPKNKTDDPDRWANPIDVIVRYPNPTKPSATNSAKDCPNANEIGWYVSKGDPHWDADPWVTMGHLYAGGIWFKKQSVIAAEQGKSIDDLKAVAPNGENYTGHPYEVIILKAPVEGKPSNLSDYFYLPALGQYFQASLGNVGEGGLYWSSTPDTGNYGAYSLFFHKGMTGLDKGSRARGVRLWKAQ